MTVDEDLALAERALEEGNTAHALFHSASALAALPTSSVALDLLEQCYRRGATIPNERWFGFVAARAYFRWWDGQPSEALSLLADVAQFRGDLPYAAWADRWLCGHDPTGGPELKSLLRWIASTTRDTIGRLRLAPAEAAWFEQLVPVVQRLRNGARDPFVHVVASGVLRRAGRYEDAAEAGRMGGNDYGALTALGLALRALGRTDEALSAFAEAEKLEADQAIRAEMGRAAWDAERFDEAMAAFEVARTRGADGDWEVDESIRYLGWRLGRAEPGYLAGRAGEAATPDLLRASMQPWFGFLPERREATVNTLWQVWDEHGSSRPVPLSAHCTAMEAPSARMAFALACTGTANPGAGDYSFTELPEPDVRVASGRAPWRYTLWPKTNVPIQAVPAPSEATADQIRALATTPYWLPRWWHAAESIDAPVEELVGAMVHPGPVPSHLPWHRWIQHVQAAAAMAMAHRNPERLFEVARSIPDWTVDAAAAALTELALQQPAWLGRTRRLLEELGANVPRPGEWHGPTVWACYRRLPGQSSETRERFDKQLDQD